MSGWGGPQVRSETREVAAQIAQAHDLTKKQEDVVCDIVHTLTYHQTYSHVELPAMFAILLSEE